MTTSLQSVDEQTTYRVAIVLPHSNEILVESDRDLRALPTISIPRWTRVAEQITTSIKRRWNLQTVVVDSLAPSDDAPGFAVLEARSYEASAVHISLRPTHLDLICLDARIRNLLCEVLTEANKYRSPLLRLRWIDEAQTWLQSNIRDRKIQFTGDIRQLNAGAGFALIRLGVSDGPAYWIKAVGPPNSHEAAITETLSKCSPTSLPPLVAVHRTWNAWAVEEVGSALTDSVDAETVSLVSLGLVRLQQNTIGHAKDLFDCGCGDQRIATLRGYLPEFLDGVAKLVDTALKDPNTNIITKLPQLEYTLHLALDELGQLGIPDTINNNDMKLANILFDGRRCVFTDWCHSYWGNPFLTFQHLHIYLSRHLPALARPFQERYAMSWADFVSEGKVQRALTFAPIVAPYAYICAHGPASLTSRAGNPGFRKLLLRIVRRISAAGEQLGRKGQHAYV